MHEKDNYLKTAELSTEQNCNMIDGAFLRSQAGIKHRR